MSDINKLREGNYIQSLDTNFIYPITKVDDRLELGKSINSYYEGSSITFDRAIPIQLDRAWLMASQPVS